MNHIQAIHQFVVHLQEEWPQTAPWLADYTTDHETQIMLNKSGMVPRDMWLGEPGLHKGWMLPHQGHWYKVNDIRIPFGSTTDTPSWPLGYREVTGPVVERFQMFGTSGWNWNEKKSHWVGFDFDSLTNHSEGLNPEQLEEVKMRAASLDYVTARTSKSGKGIHLLVYFGPDSRPTTRNHNEHALLAKDVLARMSGDCGFNFQAAADCYGRILWHWYSEMTNDGCKKID